MGGSHLKVWEVSSFFGANGTANRPLSESFKNLILEFRISNGRAGGVHQNRSYSSCGALSPGNDCEKPLGFALILGQPMAGEGFLHHCQNAGTV